MEDMKHVPNWGPHSFGVECAVVQLGANSRKVPGLISYVVTEIVHWFHLSGRNMALGPTQPLTEMSTRGIS